VQSSIDLNYFSMPNGSTTSLQIAKSCPSTFVPTTQESPAQAASDTHERVPTSGVSFSPPDSQPIRTSTSVFKPISRYLKRIFKCMKLSGGKDRKTGVYEANSKAPTGKGKLRIP
jgi:hypothetical protein